MAAAQTPNPARFYLVHSGTGRILATEAILANDWLSRLVGWAGKPQAPAGKAIGISDCDWIHTFLVRFPLDVVYCDGDGRVLHICANLKPNRFGPRVSGASIVWEMAAGGLSPFVQVGDMIQLQTAEMADAQQTDTRPEKTESAPATRSIRKRGENASDSHSRRQVEE
ncbi:MAG: hypothetical protein OHK0029_36790 [Armatimonadaceae bacterium]